MKSDCYNLFIGISPSHIKNFEYLIKSNGIKNTILLNPGSFSFDGGLWELVIVGSMKLTSNEVKFYKKFLYQLYKLKFYKNYIKDVKSQLKEVSKFNLYYCNLEDVLTNNIFFHYRSADVKERFIVEDGVLNYYHYRVENKRLLTFYYKKLICLIFGFRFRILKESITGIELDKVKYQYVRLPGKAIFPEKSLQLPYPKIEYHPKDKCILFIGQDIIINHIGEVEYLKRINYYFDYIASGYSNFKFVYKPHRNGDYTNIIELGRSYFHGNFEVFNSTEPVEEAVLKIRPIAIFTFSSSGALNLRLSIVKNSKISFYAYPFLSDKRLIDLFIKLDINIVK